MDTIIIAVIFSVPGIIVNYINYRLYPNSLPEKNEYEKTISAIITSSAIVLVNVIILKYIFNKEINSFAELASKLMYISFFIKYIFLSICVGVPLVIFKAKFLDKIINWFINLIRSSEGKQRETLFPTLWDEIFENSKEPIKNTFVTIEKDGQLLTQGQIYRYSAPNSGAKEIILTDVEEIKAYIECDKNLNDNEKLLDKVDKQYINLDTGLAIKFYNNEKILDYLNS